MHEFLPFKPFQRFVVSQPQPEIDLLLYGIKEGISKRWNQESKSS